MNVELYSLIKNEAQVSSSKTKTNRPHSVASEFRAKRQTRLIHKRQRTRREVDSSTRSPETTQSTDKPSVGKTLPSRISVGESEWSGATGGPPAEVVLRLHPAPTATTRANFSLVDTDGSGVVVRAEEALIVAFVLLLWVAAIALFFNRWGKIRMLEPYQPKFQQAHRQSCALAESAVAVPPHHRPSLARGCISYDYGVGYAAYQPCAHLAHRPRQNSVFVSSMALIPESPPRRSRSAADIPGLSPCDLSHSTPRASRAASLHSAVDIRVIPSPRTTRKTSIEDSVQVHVRGSATNVSRPKSPRRLTVTNV